MFLRPGPPSKGCLRREQRKSALVGALFRSLTTQLCRRLTTSSGDASPSPSNGGANTGDANATADNPSDDNPSDDNPSDANATADTPSGDNPSDGASRRSRLSPRQCLPALQLRRRAPRRASARFPAPAPCAALLRRGGSPKQRPLRRRRVPLSRNHVYPLDSSDPRTAAPSSPVSRQGLILGGRKGLARTPKVDDSN
jgi:hypothetical protein